MVSFSPLQAAKHLVGNRVVGMEYSTHWIKRTLKCKDGNLGSLAAFPAVTLEEVSSLVHAVVLHVICASTQRAKGRVSCCKHHSKSAAVLQANYSNHQAELCPQTLYTCELPCACSTTAQGGFVPATSCNSSCRTGSDSSCSLCLRA